MGDDQFCRSEDIGANSLSQSKNQPWLSQQIKDFYSTQFCNKEPISSLRSIMTEKVPKLGMEFNTIEEARRFWTDYGGIIGFDVRQLYANKSRVDKSVNTVRFVCAKEGLRRSDKRDFLTKNPRAETRTGCEVKMGIKLVRETGKYIIHEFEGNHNHILQIPETTHMMPSQRKISEMQGIQIDLADDSGIRPKTSLELISKQAGGKDVIGFTKQDQKNYLRDKRKRELGYGEAGSLLRYFHLQLSNNPSFHYVVQLDNEEQITNIFWADARMIIDYAIFGDVITFDTTYCTNKECRPLGVFAGFNHHREIVIFGAALLYDETAESFMWLFETFLATHKQKKPRTIFTDQDPAMAKALAKVMPETYHGLCVWHIMQNAIRHLGNMMKDGSCFLKDFKACMYNYEDESKFKEAWDSLLLKYNVESNTWLVGIYNVKEKWANCYMKDVYCIGMRSTQLSESFNGDVKDYVRSSLDIMQFFKHFERAVDDKRYKELEAEYNTRKKLPRLKMEHSPLLKQVGQLYTPKLFNLFQNEYDWSSAAYIIHRNETYEVCEYVVGIHDMVGEYKVIGNPKNQTLSCSCRKFESMGLLCCHSLKVINMWDMKKIPDEYIIKRWRRDARDIVVQDASGRVVEIDSKLSVKERCRNLCSKLVTLATRASDFEETYLFIDHVANKLHEKIDVFSKFQDDESKTLKANIIESIEQSHSLERLIENVKGLKKKQGQKGRKRLKSWVEKQPNRKTKASSKIQSLNKQSKVINLFPLH